MDKQLIVRIKMPPIGSELRFECPNCRKSFSSGKALGGHKRVHLRGAENSRSHDRPASELQILPHPENSNAHQNIHQCPICQQPFPSEKAVHGHMRKHRERNWRGMRPPIPQLVVGDGETSASDVRTSRSGGKRRPRHGKAPTDLVPETNNESISVACDLNALAQGELRKKRKLETGNSGAVAIGGGASCCSPAPSEVAGSSMRRPGNKPPSVHKMPRRAPKKYACSICHKAFKTYQALGGHKSHHFVNARRDDNSATGDLCLAGEAPGGDEQSCGGPPPPVDEVPLCPGGEKEKEKDNNQSRILVFGFDLNELPPPEE